MHFEQSESTLTEQAQKTNLYYLISGLVTLYTAVIIWIKKLI